MVFARVNTVKRSTDTLEATLRDLREEILPALREIPGSRGLLALLDRETRKSIGITLWATEEDLRASEEAANRIRSKSAEAAGGEVQSVERFEVVAFELRE